ncbi:MAG: 16S rRNA (uracil(1498)-N(3))-methyltransferase [Candidatus Omnitrophica bacterium]|jgi:16S rRNA (uracil1498-N3)-methyltransferase|nr:16S rRNA (uracil(1498)-N(3))-methyltransferase [Candidatus Omnitrophota bacterium]
MQRIRIYIKPASISDVISISDKNILNKLRNVLRLRKGHRINVFDGAGREFVYEIEELDRKYCSIRQKNILKKVKPLQKKITLAFPLVREEKLDFILQKSTELGVYEFIPFICERSLNIKCSEAKSERWKKIIREAARQSERLWLPQLNRIISFNDMISSEYDYKIVASASGDYFGGNFKGNNYSIIIVVGPEGGFSDSENQFLKDKHFKFVKLLENILRVETACIFSVGLVNYFINKESDKAK